MASKRKPQESPPESGDRRVLVLGVVATFVVSAALGVGVAFYGTDGPEEAETVVTVRESPKVPANESVTRLGDEDSDDAEEASDASALALQMARRLETAGEEAAALEILDDDAKENGEGSEAAELRLAILQRCRDLLRNEALKIRKLRSVGQDDLVLEKIATLRGRLPASLHRDLDRLSALGGEREVAKADSESSGGESSADTNAPPTVDPESDNPNLPTFKLLLRNLAGSDNPDAHFKMGKWAAERDLLVSARKCYERAVELDAYHQDAREALGHTFHEGRWYAPDAYKKQVLGLVKSPSGEWVKPEALAGGPVVTREKKRPKKATPKAGVFVPPPPPNPHKEDVAWYKDNEAVCEFEDSKVYTSKYYRIKTNVKPEYAERYGKMLDQYFKRFIAVFKAFLPKRRYSKSEIWIYASKEEFREATKMAQGVGGFYNTRTKRVTAYHGLFGPTGNTRVVLVHEGTHQFEDLVLQGKFRNAPIWIIEGLAVFFESARYTGTEVKIGEVPADRLYGLKRGLATNSLIPLRTLIRTRQQQFTGYHYAHAWGLIYMVLYYGKNEKIRKRCQKWFSDLFSAALDGPVSARDVEAGVGGRAGLKELETQWKAWIKDLPYDYDPKKH